MWQGNVTVSSEISKAGTGIVIMGTQFFLNDGLGIVKWKSGTFLKSSKIMNRMVRMRNGNRTASSNLTVIHWNRGSKRGENKLLEIESLLR